MHTHLEDMSLEDSVSTVFREIKVGFKQSSLRAIAGTGGEDRNATKLKVRDLVAKQRAEKERIEYDAKKREEFEHTSTIPPTVMPTSRPLKPWEVRQLAEDQKEFAFRELEKEWIEIMHTPKKTQLKQDRRVNIREREIQPLRRPAGKPTQELGKPRSFLHAQAVLKTHPLYEQPHEDLMETERNGEKASGAEAGSAVAGAGAGAAESHLAAGCTAGSICAAMVSISQQPACANLPVFLTMASVGDELYWQLIENFVYTLVKFDLVQCALVVCVSDDYCMRLCKDSIFPCFDYRRSVPTEIEQKKFHLSLEPSVMESIAELKLYHIPQALLQGVNTFMLDLDVGFLNDPRHMIKPFYEVPTIDIFVQQDYLFIMNRSRAGWKHWFTEPLPNIGMFLVRGNNKTHAVFAHAWKKYQGMTDPKVREQPGKDQNHVLDGMRVGRGTFGLRYAYFSNSTAALMDKIVQKWRGVELGGQPAAEMFSRESTLAMHTTCYEQSTKVMGLKATNAFWNPLYYDPLRPTLTKQILFINDDQVRDEVRSLVWLAIATNRAFVSPNLVGSDELVPTSPQHKGRAMWPGFRVTYLKRVKKASNENKKDFIDFVGFGAEAFPIDEAPKPPAHQIKMNALSIQILEPGFYWRVQRDYDDVPEAKVLLFDEGTSLTKIKTAIENEKASSRIVLHFRPVSDGKVRTNDTEVITRVQTWAQDSIGQFEEEYSAELKRYARIPSVKSIRKDASVNDVLQGMRNCNDVFMRLRGNRTCFQICD